MACVVAPWWTHAWDGCSCWARRTLATVPLPFPFRVSRPSISNRPCTITLVGVHRVCYAGWHTNLLRACLFSIVVYIKLPCPSLAHAITICAFLNYILFTLLSTLVFFSHYLVDFRLPSLIHICASSPHSFPAFIYSLHIRFAVHCKHSTRPSFLAPVLANAATLPPLRIHE